MVQFTDPEVLKEFVATVEKDRMVELPRVYRGMLSNITRSMARKMHRQGCDVLKPVEKQIEKPNVEGALAAPYTKQSGENAGQ